MVSKVSGRFVLAIMVCGAMVLAGCGGRERAGGSGRQPGKPAVVGTEPSKQSTDRSAGAQPARPGEPAGARPDGATPGSRPALAARPEPKQLLASVQNLYSSARTLRVSGTTNTTVRADGKTVAGEKNAKFSILFKRPDKYVFGSDQQQMSSNGKTAYVYIPSAKRYSKDKVDKRLRQMILQGMAASRPGVGVMGMTLGRNYQPQIASAKLLPDEKIGGRDTYVVLLKLKPGPKEPKDVRGTQKLWIGKNDLQVYKNELVITGRPPVPKGYKGKAPKLMETRSVSTANASAVNVSVPDSQFEFRPPKGARPFEKPKPPPAIKDKPAPALSFKWIDGTDKKLSDFRGKPVVLVFYALPVTEKHLPEIQKLYEKHKDSLQVIAVNLNGDRGKVAEWLKKKGFSFPTAYVEKAAGRIVWNDYGVRVLPATCLIDAEGKVKRSGVGIPSEKELGPLLRGSGSTGRTDGQPVQPGKPAEDKQVEDDPSRRDAPAASRDAPAASRDAPAAEEQQ